MKAILPKIDVGHLAEQQACEFLQTHGLQLLQQNYRCKQGEIDLIMQDKHDVVFVEVRVRNNTAFGDAIDSIDFYKQQKLIKTATHFLSQQRLLDKVNCRFDVIGINYAQSKSTMEWIKDAFSIDNF